MLKSLYIMLSYSFLISVEYYLEDLGDQNIWDDAWHKLETHEIYVTNQQTCKNEVWRVLEQGA